MKKTEQEIETNSQQPGVEGCTWRLVKHWNPDGVGDWITGEMNRQTPTQYTAVAMGSLMAAAVFGFGNCTSHFEESVMGPQGVVHHFNEQLKAKMNRRVRTDGGVILPQPGEKFTQ